VVIAVVVAAIYSRLRFSPQAETLPRTVS
jgi:hypothetical protein